MLKFQLPIATGNRTIQDGSLPRILPAILEGLRPEAAYFLIEGGVRTGYVVFDLKESGHVPLVAERLFQAFEATVQLTPVMNAQELAQGLEAAARKV